MFRLKLWSPFALQKHGRYFQRRSEDMHSVNTLSQWLIKHLTPWWNRNTGPIYRLLYFFLDTPGKKKKKTCHRGWTCPHVCTENTCLDWCLLAVVNYLFTSLQINQSTQIGSHMKPEVTELNPWRVSSTVSATWTCRGGFIYLGD